MGTSSPSSREYVMREAILKHYHTLHGKSGVACYLCLEPIKVGDPVHRNRSSGKTKYFHQACFDRTVFDC